MASSEERPATESSAPASTAELYRRLHEQVIKLFGIPSHATGTVILPPSVQSTGWVRYSKSAEVIGVVRDTTDAALGALLREDGDSRGSSGSAGHKGQATLTQMRAALESVVTAEVIALFEPAGQQDGSSFNSANPAIAAALMSYASNAAFGPVFEELGAYRWKPGLADIRITPHGGMVLRSFAQRLVHELSSRGQTTDIAVIGKYLREAGNDPVLWISRELARSAGFDDGEPRLESVVLPALSLAITTLGLAAIAASGLEEQVQDPHAPAALGEDFAGFVDGELAGLSQFLDSIAKATDIAVPGRQLLTTDGSVPQTIPFVDDAGGPPGTLAELFDRTRTASSFLIGGHSNVSRYVTEQPIGDEFIAGKKREVAGIFTFSRGTGKIGFSPSRVSSVLRKYLARVEEARSADKELALDEAELDEFALALTTVIHEHLHALGPDEGVEPELDLMRQIPGGRILAEGLTDLGTSCFSEDFASRLRILEVVPQLRGRLGGVAYVGEASSVIPIVREAAVRSGQSKYEFLKSLLSSGSMLAPLELIATAFLTAHETETGKPAGSPLAPLVIEGVILDELSAYDRWLDLHPDAEVRDITQAAARTGAATVSRIDGALALLDHIREERTFGQRLPGFDSGLGN